MGFRRRRAQDRAVEQWRRDLELRLHEPIDVSELTEPSRHSLGGGLPSYVPVPDGPPRRVRRTRGALLPGLAVVIGLFVFVMLSNPGSTTYWAKEMVRRATGGTSSSYAFLSVDTATGTPVTWSSCEPIRYRINPDTAPPEWEGLVSSAIAEVEDSSGYDFVYDGTSSDRDFQQRRPSAPVLIGWGVPSEYDELTGDVAGFGGATSVVVGGRPRYVTGEVLLDSGDYARMAASGDDDAMRLILVHEIGHVLGLDHVDDRHQLMYPSYHGQGGLGPGDVEGLQRLHDQPCP